MAIDWCLEMLPLQLHIGARIHVDGFKLVGRILIHSCLEKTEEGNQ